MNFNDTLLLILEQEIALAKPITQQDKEALQNKIKLKNDLLKKKNKKLSYDSLSGKAKITPLTPIDKKIDTALDRIRI